MTLFVIPALFLFCIHVIIGFRLRQSETVLRENQKFVSSILNTTTPRTLTDTHEERNYEITFLVHGNPLGPLRRTEHNRRRRKVRRDSGLDIFTHLAAISGGSVINSNKTDVDHASSITVAEASLTSPVVVMMTHVDAADTSDVTFSVDTALQILLVEITGHVTRSDITIKDPSGVVNGKDVATAVDSFSELALKFMSPKPGIWQLHFSKPMNNEVKVKGSSDVSFQYDFLTRHVYPGMPPSLLSVPGYPLAGKTLTLAIEVNGVEQAKNVTTVTLYTLNGDVIKTADLIPITAGRKRNSFKTEIKLPEQELRIGISGLDNHGNPFTRVSQTAVSPIPEFVLILNIPKDHRGVDIPFTVINNGDGGVFVLNVSSDNTDLKAVIVSNSFSLPKGANCSSRVIVTTSSSEPSIEGNITLTITSSSGHSRSDTTLVQIRSSDTAATIPPTSGIKPHGSNTIPPTSGIKPHGSNTIPPTSGIKPHGSNTIPPTSGIKPHGSNTIPQTSGIKPHGSNTIPQTSGIKPHGSNTIPQTSGIKPHGSNIAQTTLAVSVKDINTSTTVAEIWSSTEIMEPTISSSQSTAVSLSAIVTVVVVVLQVYVGRLSWSYGSCRQCS